MRDGRALRGLWIFCLTAGAGACASLPSAQRHLPVSPPEFEIRLPPGSWLQREQGIDTTVWTIRKPHGPTVHYDANDLPTIAPRNFKAVAQWIRECEWDADDDVSLPTPSNPNGDASCHILQSDATNLFDLDVMFPDGVSFSAIDLKSMAQVREIVRMVLTYSPGSFDRGLFIDTATLRQRIDRGWNVKRDGPRLMESAIHWDAADVVTLLAHSGVDAQGGPDGKTYLTIAIQENRPSCVRALIAAGARLDPGSSRDRDAAVAAAGKSLELLQIVVAQGLGVNTTDKGGATMLMVASGSEQTDIVRWLLDQGARIDTADNEGQTALMTATWVGTPKIVALLLSRDAARDLQNRQGQTAVMITEARANETQGHLDAMRQQWRLLGYGLGPDGQTYLEGLIVNWRAIAALLQPREDLAGGTEELWAK
jgi:hypothetical protein